MDRPVTMKMKNIIQLVTSIILIQVKIVLQIKIVYHVIPCGTMMLYTHTSADVSVCVCVLALFMLFHIDSSDSYSPIKTKGKKRKDTTHDNTREDIKELKPNSSNESLSNINFINNDSSYEQNNTDYKIADEDKALDDVPVTIELDSGIFTYIKCMDFDVGYFYTQCDDIIYMLFSIDSTSEPNSDLEYVESLAKKEVGVGNVDPLDAQKRAFAVCKIEQLKSDLSKLKVNMRYV